MLFLHYLCTQPLLLLVTSPFSPFSSLFTLHIYLSAHTVSSIPFPLIFLFTPCRPVLSVPASFSTFTSFILFPPPSLSLDCLPLILHSHVVLLLLYSLCSFRLNTAPSSDSPSWCILHTHVPLLSPLYCLWPLSYWFSSLSYIHLREFVMLYRVFAVLLLNWIFRKCPFLHCNTAKLQWSTTLSIGHWAQAAPFKQRWVW